MPSTVAPPPTGLSHLLTGLYIELRAAPSTASKPRRETENSIFASCAVVSAINIAKTANTTIRRILAVLSRQNSQRVTDWKGRERSLERHSVNCPKLVRTMMTKRRSFKPLLRMESTTNGRFPTLQTHLTRRLELKRHEKNSIVYNSTPSPPFSPKTGKLLHSTSLVCKFVRNNWLH